MQKYNFQFFTNTISMAVNCDEVRKFKYVITRTILIISGTADAFVIFGTINPICRLSYHRGRKTVSVIRYRDFEVEKPRSEIHKLSELRRILLCFERGRTRAEWAEMNLRILFAPEPNNARDV